MEGQLKRLRNEQNNLRKLEELNEKEKKRLMDLPGIIGFQEVKIEKEI